jgi:hypothetical protein
MRFMAVSSEPISVWVVVVVPARTESARAVSVSNRLDPFAPKASGPSMFTATLTSLPIVRCTVPVTPTKVPASSYAFEPLTTPPKTGRPRYAEFAPSRRLPRSCSISAASASRAAGLWVRVLTLRIARSLTRRTWSSIEVSVRSAWPSRPRPSSALREYCVSSASDARIRIAAVVLVGESDGRLRIRPVESCSWLLASRLSPVWRDR